MKKTTFALCGLTMAMTAMSARATEPTALYDSIPAAWSYESEYADSSEASLKWWEGFDDPLLTALIKRAGENSLSVKAMAHRMEMARRSWQAARAGWYPTIGLSAGWNRARTSGLDTRQAMPATTNGFFDLGLNFNWELDVFGKTASGVKAEKMAWMGERQAYDAALISLYANVATAYVNMRLVQQEILVAEKQIESQQKVKNMTEARYEAGLASSLDVQQALTVLYSTQATLPKLNAQLSSAFNSIALLCGCYPDELDPALKTPQMIPNPFRVVTMGVPADLLRRRPDIMQAEYEVAQYAASLGVAKKDFLPTLALSGSIGTSAHRIDDLFKKESFTWSVAPTLSWTLFEGMGRSYRLASAKEQVMAAIDNYNLTVMNSVIEVQDALSGYEGSLKQIELLRQVTAASEEAFKLAVDRYKRGLTSFTDVMSSQISLLNYMNSRLEARAEAVCDAIKVYAAVAGAPESESL